MITRAYVIFHNTTICILNVDVGVGGSIIGFYGSESALQKKAKAGAREMTFPLSTSTSAQFRSRHQRFYLYTHPYTTHKPQPRCTLLSPPSHIAFHTFLKYS
jgi:hypothetical protein